MADGTPRPIEEIREGDMVLADFCAGDAASPPPCVRPARVTGTSMRFTGAMIHAIVATADGASIELDATPEHPFYLRDESRFVPLEDLQPGDTLIDDDGAELVVVDVSAASRAAVVFNLIVEGAHTYFVGGTGDVVLVHNGCAPGVGGRGWRGDSAWRANQRDLASGGTWERLRGGIPTAQEAAALIEEGGGTIVRIDPAHPVGGVSTHTYPHINYTTTSGTRGTVRIQ
jgi:hypothetical protein